MPTREEKLAALLTRIKENSYNAKALADMVGLQERIAKDINCDDSVEAMALLGYLLKYKYVIIDRENGIILSQDKGQDISLLMKE
jgi:hypothetical protein